MTFILPSFGASAIAAVPGGGGGSFTNDYSLSCDGVDDYLSLGDLSSLVGGQNDVSYSIWVNYSSTGNQGLLGNTAATGEAYIYSGTFYATQLHDSTFANLGSLSANTWHHIVCSRTSTNTTFYKDGSVASTNSYSATATLSTLFNSDMRVGVAPRLGWYSNVKVDEFALFTSALSASDVTSIYNSGVPNDISSYSPVGWWRMGDNDSGTGTTITDQGSGSNDGTLTNGPTFSTNVPFNYYSVDFDGTNDTVTVPNIATYFTNNATAVTISAWIKLDTTSDGGYEIARFTSNVGIYFNAYKSGGTYSSITCGYHDGGNFNQIICTTDIFDGNWHHVAYTYDQPTNVIKGYIDGSLETPSNTQASGTPTWETFTSFNIGSTSVGTNPFNGLIDEVAVWPSVLSASNIASIYNSGVPADLTSYAPVGWWRMGDNDSGTGTTITDQGSEGNNGTLTNGPTFSTNVPT